MGVQAEDIKARLCGQAGIVDLLGRLDLNIKSMPRGGVAVLCPFHADSHPSCEFFDKGGGWMWCCHPCGKGGDVIKFASMYSGISDRSEFPKLMEWLGGVLGVAGREGGLSAEQREALAKKRREEMLRHVRIAETNRARAVGEALELWDASEECCRAGSRAHQAARRYLETRGVDWKVLDLGGGGWEKMWRWCPRARREYYVLEAGERKAVREEVPGGALVLGCCNGERQITAVQRIYLGADGGKIGYGLDGKMKSTLQKQTLGSLCGTRLLEDGTQRAMGGVTCRLTGRAASGVLILCEGADATGPALLQAVIDPETGERRAAVWPCLSTHGLESFRLTAKEAEWVRGIVIAGDFDKSKAGQRAAAACGSNMLEQVQGDEWKSWGGFDAVDVRICLPDAAVSGELVDEMMEAA